MKDTHSFLIIANHVSGAEKRFFNAFRASENALLIANQNLVSLYEKHGQLKADDSCRSRILPLREYRITRMAQRLFFRKKGLKAIFILLQRVNMLVEMTLKRKRITKLSSVHAVLDGVRYLPFIQMLHPDILRFASVVDPTLAFRNHRSRLFGLKHCHHIDALNKNIRDELVHLGYDPDIISITPHSFTDYSLIKTGYKKPVITFCARLIPPKNPILFLEAALRFGAQNEFPDVRFMLMGEGPLMPELLKMQSESAYLRKNLTICGYVSAPAETFSSSLIFVQLSDTEIHATQSMLEAMGAECYIMAAALEGLEKTLHPDFSETVPKDADAIATRFRELLLSGEETIAKGKAARVYAGKNFSVDGFLRYLESIYLKVHQPVREYGPAIVINVALFR